MGLEGPGAELGVQGLPVPADLPVLEERPRGGEALEGHDRPAPAGGGAVAPAEGLSPPGRRVGGPPSQPPPPLRGAPGKEPRGWRDDGPAGGDPGVGGGWSPPVPRFRLSLALGHGGARSRPGPPAEEGARSDDVPVPDPGQDFCECFQPRSLGPPLPLPGLASHFRGPGCGCERAPPPCPPPFQLNKTSLSRQRRPSGAAEPPPCPATSPPPSPSAPPRPRWAGTGWGASKEGRAAPFPGPGAGSWDRKP